MAERDFTTMTQEDLKKAREIIYQVQHSLGRIAAVAYLGAKGSEDGDYDERLAPFNEGNMFSQAFEQVRIEAGAAWFALNEIPLPWPNRDPQAAPEGGA